MNSSRKPPHQSSEAEPQVSDLMPYIRAAKDQFPSKEELFAEINSDRDHRKKLTRTVYTAIVVFFAASIWAVNPTISTEIYTTQYAENAQFSLPDGSRVHLNSNTSLIAKLRLRSRELTLEKGEASFTVQHELRPFTVAVYASTVRDIGTIFNLSTWQESFTATVLEGEVELQTGDQKTRLMSGQAMHVSPAGGGAPYPADLDRVTAWHTGKILFNKTPLKEAVTDIQRYRKATIQLDPRVENLLVTGIYDVSKVEQLLDSMESMFPVKVTRLDDGEIKIQKN